MKKFLKFVTIIGCVLILVGTGVATASFSLGANPMHVFEDWEERFDQYFEDDRYEHHTVAIEETITPHLAETIVEESFDALREEAVASIENGEESFALDFDEVNDLEITIKGGTVTMIPDEEAGYLSVITTNGRKERISYYSFDRYKKLEVTAKEGEDYLIRIPFEWRLSELEVDCAGGEFDGSEVRTSEAELTVSGGEIQIHQIGGKETSLDCAGGDLTWSGSGELSRKIEVDCAGGDVSLTLDSGVDPEKVGYEIDYAGGTIDLFGSIYDGMGAQEGRGSNGMPHLELDVAGGTIIVR